jgi:tripartite-type tricarboxylate transporter receptor subunit TctC
MLFLRKTLKSMAAAIIAFTTLGLDVHVHADSYPSKPITILIGFSAGGGMDTTASVLLPEAEAFLGQPIVKSVQPGGGGAKSMALLKDAEPDGYTIGLGATSIFAFNPVVMPDQTPFSAEDFEFIVAFAGSGEAIMAKADAPFDTIEEMIAYAKEGHSLTYSGQTPFDRLLIQYLNKKEAINIRLIPTNGGAEAIKNILGGHTDLSFTGGNHKKFVEEGQVKILASLRAERLEMAPDVPSMVELGYPLEFGNILFITVPKGTPDEVKQKLFEAFSAARDSESFTRYSETTPYFKVIADEAQIGAAIEAQADNNRQVLKLIAE